MYKGGVIFLYFVLAAHLLIQIKHYALTAVRSADILRQTFLGMICRVRIKTAGIQTFQTMKHLVKVLLRHSVE